MLNKLLLACALILPSVSFATGHMSDENLNQEPTLNLTAEAKLTEVEIPRTDKMEFAYSLRELGSPILKTPLQDTQYDFGSRGAPTFGYRRSLISAPAWAWDFRVSYYDIELHPEAELSTRLHAVPVQTEVLWSPTYKTFRPFTAVGLMGLLQIQRGAEPVLTSELDGLFTARAGFDANFSSDWAISASYMIQKTFEESADEWSGHGFDIGLIYTL